MKRYVGETFDLDDLYTRLFGYVAEPFPALNDVRDQILPPSPLGTINALIEQYKKTLVGTEILMPLKLGLPKQEMWDVPTEPMVSIKGGHRIVRRYPNRSNRGGSIKERWSSDDYGITIKGALLNFKDEHYPEDQVKRLREICEYKGAIRVENPLFRIFGIERMVIDSFSIPFTQGLPAQSYTISGYSDQLFDALLTET